MAQKEYLKMADEFSLPVKEDTLEVYCRQHIGESFGSCEVYASHAINSHDELVAEVERLRDLTEEAFIDGCEAGFALSAEGVNGEHNVVRYEVMMYRFKCALDEYKKGL